MKSALALATALLMPAVTSAAAVPPNDVLETRGKQIVGGSAASAGEFPFIVSLSQGGSHFCGGSLLNAYTVVTAAHCSVGQSPSSVKVRAGTLTWASGGTQVGVSSIVVNPNYNSGTYNNDVALWHLSSPIQSGGNIGYVSLPSSGSDPASGSTSTVAGWGVTNESSGSLPSSLRKVDVPIVSRSTCRSQYGTSAITTGMVCAGVPQGGKDSCQGDSGGPLLNSADQLIGIVSWGEGCARPDLSGVYTNVGNYVSWINSNKWTS